MPWTIPNLLLHDKQVPLSNMRSHGRNRVFVCCSNPDCYHNAELDVSGFADHVTFNDMQPRMVCSVCDHRGADASRHGCFMVDWSRRLEDPIELPDGRKMLTLKEAAGYIMKLPKAEQDLPEWQAATEALIMAAEGRGPLMHAGIGVLRALNRNVERTLTDRKEMHWGRRKLKRGQQ